MRIYIFKKSEFSPVHIVSPIAVSKSFPYNLDIKRQSNKSMCTVRLVSQIDIKWTVYICPGNWGLVSCSPSVSGQKSRGLGSFCLIYLSVNCLGRHQYIVLQWLKISICVGLRYVISNATLESFKREKYLTAWNFL